MCYEPWPLAALPLLERKVTFVAPWIPETTRIALRKGLPHGSPTSPSVGWWTWIKEGKGWSCNRLFYPLLAFADDLYIVAPSAEQAQHMLSEQHHTLKMAGMKL